MKVTSLPVLAWRLEIQSARRKVVWEEINGLISAINEDRRKGRPKQFASETASVMGVSKSQTNAKIARARELGDDIHRIPGNPKL